MRQMFQLLGPHTSMGMLITHVLLRLVLAAVLGGIIGIERELKRKPAGLRTQMFICFGAAMFTVLSDILAAGWGGDHTRIAAQIIPGIGFIGAGSILHSRGSVTGLTTAATLFVVASIGMAVGGGLYLPAVFATVVILLALLLLGWLETRLSLKPLVMLYEADGRGVEEVLFAVNEVLEQEHCAMQRVQIARVDGGARVQFAVDTTRKEHDALYRQLRQSPALQSVQLVGEPEPE